MNPILCTVAGEHENQDRGAVIKSGQRIVLIVADGAGGFSGGTEAAEMAVKFVSEHAELLDNANACVSILHKMDQHISLSPKAGETTCAIAVVADNRVFGASVGDSGVWIIRHTGYTDLTTNQIRKPLIGSGSVRAVGFRGGRVKGKYLLLATDGLIKYAPCERIIAICREYNTQSAAQQLVELVRYPSGALPDDVTVILADL